MHTKWSKLICVIAALALLTVSLTSCDFSLESFFNQDNGPEPVAVSLKTDLKDAKFTFTYGQLKEVLPLTFWPLCLKITTKKPTT